MSRIINSLQKKLLEIKEEDQCLMKTGAWNEEIGKNHVAELKKIIKEWGWPGISIAGKDGEEAAWLIAQHADFDIKFQSRCLKLLKKALDEKEAFPHQIPYLTDRILKKKYGYQLYGTQFFKNKRGVFEPYPIIEKEALDKRRKKYGLEPFDVYMKAFLNYKKNPRSKNK